MQHFEHYFLTYIISIPFVAKISGTHIKQCALVSPHQLLIGNSSMKKFTVSAGHQLLIRHLGELAATTRGGRVGQNSIINQLEGAMSRLARHGLIYEQAVRYGDDLALVIHK